MSGNTTQLYSTELQELATRLRQLYIEELAYEEVVFNAEKYLLDDVRQALKDLPEPLLKANDELNIEKITRNTDLIPHYYQTVSLEGLLTGISFNIIGYKRGASPYGDTFHEGLTYDIGQENHLWKLKNFEPSTPSPIDKGNYGGHTLVDDVIFTELKGLQNKTRLFDSEGGFLPSPFWPDDDRAGITQDRVKELVLQLEIFRNSYKEILANGRSQEQSHSRLGRAAIDEWLAGVTGLNFPQRSGYGKLQNAWATGPSNDEIYRNNFKSFLITLSDFGFPRPVDLGSPDHPHFDFFQRRIEEIRQKLIADLPEVMKDRSDALKRNVVARAITTEPEELIFKEFEKQNLTPYDFQCFLLENIGALVDLRQSGGRYSPDYQNIITVNSGDPATVINVIQHGSNPEGVEQFLNICPEVYGMLTPFLKVSRMEYDDLGNIKIKDGEAVEKELKIPNFLTQGDVSGILSGDVGRAPGAGIKSFSWSLDGVQPAEVDNNITATLVMYFQSINDFFHGARSAGQDEPNFLDLIINAERVKNMRKKGTCPDTKPDNSRELVGKNITRKAAGNDFRIKVCAGWSVPENLQAVMKNTSEVKIKALKAALRNSRASFFLQQTRHQINFNEDGSVELTVNYQAALAGLLTGKTANILAPSSAIHLQDIEGNKEKICKLESYEFTDHKASIEELREENKLLRKQDKLVKYKKLLKKLFGRFESGNCAGVSPRIYNLSVNPNELLLTPFKDLSVVERQERVKRRQKDGFLKFTTSAGQQSALLDNVTKASYAPGKLDAADGYSEEETARLEDILTDKEINIPFFFLGDLFDSILEQIKENNKGEALNFKFFISDVDMIDPLQAFKLDNLEDLLDAGLNLADASFLNELKKSQPDLFPGGMGITRLMNIGDIPISVDAFQLWFKNNVIKKDRDKYYFLYFVKDICKDLVTKALDSKCFGDELDFKQRFDAVPLTLATKDEDMTETLLPGGEYTALQLAKAKTNLNCETDSRRTSLGIILYSTDAKPRNLIADYKSDFDKGIYHHFIGSSCGLVKKINFQREDQAFLRETKIQKKGALGAEQLRELYSANLDLVGNNLYKNGMYIYINPSLIDADTPFLDYLGLHGYYFVTSVKSTVTPSGFDTQISALHEGIEFRDQALLSAKSGFAGRGTESAPDEPVRGDGHLTGEESQAAGRRRRHGQFDSNWKDVPSKLWNGVTSWVTGE